MLHASLSICQSLSLLVSIDGHPLWVYAADGGYVRPIKVETINVPIGERFQAFIKYVQFFLDGLALT